MKRSHLSYILLTFALSFLSDSYSQSIEDQFDKLLLEKFKADEPGGTALIVKQG
jgi:hypothetical protein